MGPLDGGEEGGLLSLAALEAALEASRTAEGRHRLGDTPAQLGRLLPALVQRWRTAPGANRARLPWSRQARRQQPFRPTS